MTSLCTNPDFLIKEKNTFMYIAHLSVPTYVVYKNMRTHTYSGTHTYIISSINAVELNMLMRHNFLRTHSGVDNHGACNYKLYIMYN